MPIRLAAPLAAALAAVLVAGCGGSSGDESDRARTPTAPIGASATSCRAHSAAAEGLRATGIPCSQARQVLYGWQREPSCSPPAGASRSSCLTRSYRCLSARTDRGIAVGCARPGQSVAFVAQRR